MKRYGLISRSFVNLCQPLRGVQRTRHGSRTTGQTPALEELDRSQEAEGKTVQWTLWAGLKQRHLVCVFKMLPVYVEVPENTKTQERWWCVQSPCYQYYVIITWASEMGSGTGSVPPDPHDPFCYVLHLPFRKCVKKWFWTFAKDSTDTF